MAGIEEREMRSLDRPGLRCIFGALDPDERLPRELVVDPGIATRGTHRRLIALLWPVGFLAAVALLALTLAVR